MEFKEKKMNLNKKITWYVLSKLSYINLVINEVFPTWIEFFCYY